MARRAFRRRVRPLLEWLPMSYDWSRRPTPSRNANDESHFCIVRRLSWPALLLTLMLSLAVSQSGPRGTAAPDPNAVRGGRNPKAGRWMAISETPRVWSCWLFSSWASPPGGEARARPESQEPRRVSVSTAVDWDSLREAEFPVARQWAYFDHAAVAPLPRRSGSMLRAWIDEQEQDGVVGWSARETAPRDDP